MLAVSLVAVVLMLLLVAAEQVAQTAAVEAMGVSGRVGKSQLRQWAQLPQWERVR